MKANPDGWLGWRTSEVDPFGLDEVPERPIQTESNPGRIVCPEISNYLASTIPELRIIGEHLASGRDGHPFKTDDYNQDIQPLTIEQRRLS